MDTKKKIILITEDEPSMLRILNDKIIENGFATIQAKNGEEGLQQALTHHPDLILLDVLMPKLDGMAMMNKLRGDDWCKNVPIIILSNVSTDSDETLQEIMKGQPAYYLMKSNTQLDDIVSKIQEILSPSASA